MNGEKRILLLLDYYLQAIESGAPEALEMAQDMQVRTCRGALDETSYQVLAHILARIDEAIYHEHEEHT